MLAITVQQPYANQLVTDTKRHEIRAESIPRNTIVAIHSARRKSANPEAAGLPCGCLLGTVKVISCETRQKGGYAWYLAEPRQLEVPIRAEGSLGVWTLPRMLEHRLLLALAEDQNATPLPQRLPSQKRK